MNRLLFVVLLFSAFIAQNRTLTFGVISKNTPQMNAHADSRVAKKQIEKKATISYDSTGLNLIGSVDTVYVQSFMESTHEPVTVQFLLKTSKRGDTLAASKNGYQAVLPVPYELFTPLVTTPEFPFPYPNAIPYHDSIYPFKIVPTKNDQLLSGITAFDLTLMSRHIIGLDTFTSPYKLIAADVNKDGLIDVQDLLILRRIVLRIDTVFKKVPHWIFIPKTYKMLALQPTIDSIPKAYYFNAYSSGLPNPFEFTVIKMGDINNSFHDTTANQNNQTAIRNSKESLVLRTENTLLEKGKTYEIALKCTKTEQFTALEGAFSLSEAHGTEGGQKINIGNFDALESETLTNFGEQNQNKSDHQIVFYWNDIADKIFNNNEPLFKIKFKANADGKLSDILKLNNDLSENMVYTEGGESRKIELQFSELPKDFYVFQNEPNPFVGETTLKIEIKTKNDAAIPTKYAVFDENGHILFQRSQLFTSGIHLLRLNANEMGLTKPGIYILNVETPTGKQAIKLLKM